VRRTLALPEQLGQSVAFDQLHREEGSLIGEGAELVNWHDARVLELAADLRLLDEPAHNVGVIAVIVAQHLERDFAAKVWVAAFEDDAHASAGDLAVDAVARGGVFVMAAGSNNRSRGLARRRVAENHARNRPDRLGDRGERALAGRLKGSRLGRLAHR